MFSLLKTCQKKCNYRADTAAKAALNSKIYHMKKTVLSHLKTLDLKWGGQCGPEFLATEVGSDAVRSIISVDRNDPINFGPYFFRFQIIMQKPICKQSNTPKKIR